jgi:hypothetical protein
VGGPLERLEGREKAIGKALRACIQAFLAKGS